MLFDIWASLSSASTIGTRVRGGMSWAQMPYAQWSRLIPVRGELRTSGNQPRGKLPSLAYIAFSSRKHGHGAVAFCLLLKPRWKRELKTLVIYEPKCSYPGPNLCLTALSHSPTSFRLLGRILQPLPEGNVHRLVASTHQKDSGTPEHTRYAPATSLPALAIVWAVAAYPVHNDEVAVAMGPPWIDFDRLSWDRPAVDTERVVFTFCASTE